MRVPGAGWRAAHGEAWGPGPDGAPAAPPGPGLSTHRFTLMSTHRMKARPARSPKRTEMVVHRLPLAREM